MVGLSPHLLGEWSAESPQLSVSLGDFLSCREPCLLRPLLSQGGRHPKTHLCGNMRQPAPLPKLAQLCRATPVVSAELSAQAALWLNFSIFPILIPSLPSHRDPRRTASSAFGMCVYLRDPFPGTGICNLWSPGLKLSVTADITFSPRPVLPCCVSQIHLCPSDLLLPPRVPQIAALILSSLRTRSHIRLPERCFPLQSFS